VAFKPRSTRRAYFHKPSILIYLINIQFSFISFYDNQSRQTYAVLVLRCLIFAAQYFPYLLPVIVLINILGVNLRGSPDPFRDHPSCGDLPITRIRPVVGREMGDYVLKCFHQLKNTWPGHPCKHQMRDYRYGI
jgi:hypothetical protein